MASTAIQGEELHSNEEQGKVNNHSNELQQRPMMTTKSFNKNKKMTKNLNSASAAIFEPPLAGANADVKSRRSRSKKDNLTLKLNRHKSDM